MMSYYDPSYLYVSNIHLQFFFALLMSTIKHVSSSCLGCAFVRWKQSDAVPDSSCATGVLWYWDILLLCFISSKENIIFVVSRYMAVLEEFL
jgi:hypothetical protein